MAGNGQRFIDEGYKVPKPLININGKPMVVLSAECLPKADLWIFICRKNHIDEFKIDKVLKDFFPKSIIISIDYLTEGQASTCLLAKDYLLPNDILTIGACDNSMVYNLNDLKRSISTNEVLVWTFRKNRSVLKNPEMYGWVNVDKNGLAKTISCKKPISNNPLNDHAIVGTFYFRKASFFIDNALKVIKSNRRINNEFYMDIVADECIISGLGTSVFEIEKYICWGTPKDLNSYLSN